MPGIPGMALCLILPNKSSWGELTPDPVRNHMAESAIKVPSPVSLRLTQQAKLSVQCQLFFWPFTKAYKESISTKFGHVLIIVVEKKPTFLHLGSHICDLLLGFQEHVKSALGPYCRQCFLYIYCLQYGLNAPQVPNVFPNMFSP